MKVEIRTSRGAITVYGIAHLPITLYKDQWIKLLEAEPELRAFLDANKERLNPVPDRPFYTHSPVPN